MKRTPLKRRTPLKAKRTLSRTRKAPKNATKRILRPNRGIPVPDWFMEIKPGSHGSNPVQKRLWRIVSERVREEEHRKYGRCVSCDRHIDDWRSADCGHYKAWSVCNGIFRYERVNLALQCKNCNRLSDGPTMTRFGEELKRRYGNDILTFIEEENNRHRGTKMENHVLIGLAAMWLGKEV